MSKWATFFKIAGTVGVQALKFTPLAPIAETVGAAIAEAQAIPDASGPDKLTHVTNIAIQAANAANVQAGRVVVDPVLVQQEAASAITTAVGAIKLVHDAHQAPAA